MLLQRVSLTFENCCCNCVLVLVIVLGTTSLVKICQQEASMHPTYFGPFSLRLMQSVNDIQKWKPVVPNDNQSACRLLPYEGGQVTPSGFMMPGSCMGPSFNRWHTGSDWKLCRRQGAARWDYKTLSGYGPLVNFCSSCHIYTLGHELAFVTQSCCLSAAVSVELLWLLAVELLWLLTGGPSALATAAAAVATAEVWLLPAELACCLHHGMPC